MDMEKFVQKLSQSQEFMELLNRERIKMQEEAGEYDYIVTEEEAIAAIREVRRARMMEPAVDEGEWLLNNSQPAGDD